MQPPAEFVHWMFATGLVLVGLCLAAQAIVGDEVWRRRAWRAYLWPGLAFTMGVLLFPVMVFFTNSTIHMLAHGSWAQVMMLSGAAELTNDVLKRDVHVLLDGKPLTRVPVELGLVHV